MGSSTHGTQASAKLQQNPNTKGSQASAKVTPQLKKWPQSPYLPANELSH